MKSTEDGPALDAIRAAAHVLSGTEGEHDALLELIADAHWCYSARRPMGRTSSTARVPASPGA